MARIQTFDHCGFVVEDIPRSHQFYNSLLGGKPLHIQNLNTQRLYKGGFPVMSFVEMGGHRFELCLAQEPLPEAAAGNGMPRIGFSVTRQVMDELIKQLEENKIPHEGPIEYPDAVPFEHTIRVWDPDGNTLEFCVRR
jgi:catechol 2,3-dioxygenase-like lactoylglutathione lyase family enzyme